MKTILFALSILLVAACGGVNDGDITGGPRTNHPMDTPADPNAQPTGNPVSATDPTQPAPSAGTATTTTAPTDGGAPDGTAPANAFTGAGAYVATLGTSTIRTAHNFANNNPVKQDCLGCHNFFAAGSVFKDAAATMPASSVEIRVRSANGGAVSSFTDANGNFFITAAAAAAANVTLPAQVGVRDGTTTKLMSATIAAGGCNASTCHGGAQGWAHL